MISAIAFHGDPALKEAVLRRLRRHTWAGKRTVWMDAKGTGVGSAPHDNDLSFDPTRLGFPLMLASLVDEIFSGLPNPAASEWPIRFMASIQPGADLSRVCWFFLHWLLTEKEINLGIDHEIVSSEIMRCTDLLLWWIEEARANRTKVTRDAVSLASREARRLEDAAAHVDEGARKAASVARLAMDALADWLMVMEFDNPLALHSSAKYAAWAAETAAFAAGSSREQRQKAYSLMADKLVELLWAAPPFRLKEGN